MSRRFLGLITVLSLMFAASSASAQSDEAVFWQSISGSSDGAEFCAYLEAFPNGKFVALAKLRAKKLGTSCGGAAQPAPVAKPATPKKQPVRSATTLPPSYAIRVSPEEMKRTHDALLDAEPGIVGFTNEFPQSRVKPCFDCADVLLVCRSATVAGAHHLKNLSIAALDFETAKSGYIWLKDQSNNVFEADPTKIVDVVANGGADCAAFGGGPLRYGEHYREPLLNRLRDRVGDTTSVAAKPSVKPRKAEERVRVRTTDHLREIFGAAADGVAIKWQRGDCARLQGDGTAKTVSYKGGPRTAYDYSDSSGSYGIWGLKNKGIGANFCIRHSTSDQWDCWKVMMEGSVAHFHPPAGFGPRQFSGVVLPPEEYKNCPKMSFDALVNAANREKTLMTSSEIDPLDESRYVLKNANVRAAPSTNGAKLFVMNAGEQVQVTGKVRGENWYQIKLGGSDLGYIFGTLLGDQRPGGGPSVASAAPAPALSAPASPAPSSAGNSNLPSTDEANGPLCDFFGEGNGWKLYAGFDSVAVTSMDERETFTVHNGFEAGGFSLGVSDGEESGKEVSLDLWNVRKNGKLVYDRIEAINPEYSDSSKFKKIDGELSITAGGDAKTISATSTVFDSFVGSSSIDFNLPISWMMEKLRAGQEIAIDLHLQGSRAVSMTIDTSTFIDAFRHVNRAQSKMINNRANGRCGFGAGRPSASNGLLACTQVASRSAGYFEGARFAVIPGKWAKTAKEHADASPKKVDVMDISFPVYEILDQVGYFPIDGVVFYDRNIRVRENPNGGGPLIIGEFVDSELFKQMADKFEPNNFRCELVAEVRTCPHAKYAWASEPCQ